MDYSMMCFFKNSDGYWVTNSALFRKGKTYVYYQGLKDFRRFFIETFFIGPRYRKRGWYSSPCSFMENKTLIAVPLSVFFSKKQSEELRKIPY